MALPTIKRSIRVSEYLQRAEVLKSTLKSKEALFIEDSRQGGANEFEDLCDRYPPLQTALLLVNAAKKLAVANRLHKALQTYQEALDIALPFTSKCRPEEREVLRTEAKKWLDAAELVKSYMTMQTLGVEGTVPLRSESTCVLQ